MMEQAIYQRRFVNTDQRRQMWQVLVPYFFQRYIRPSDVVLDMPVGYGEFINTVQCYQKHAVDINPDSAQYLDAEVKFHLCSATNTDLKNQSIDVVFISNFFEHITKNQIVAVITELQRILKPGGRVLVLQPNIRFCASDYWMFFDHITPIDDRALLEVFAIHKFTPLLNIPRFLPYTTQSRIPQYPWLIKLYLQFPLIWQIMGKQSFLIFKK